MKVDNTILLVIILLLTMNFVSGPFVHIWIFFILGIVIYWYLKDCLKSFALAAVIVVFMYLFRLPFARYEYFDASPPKTMKQEDGELEKEADEIQEEGEEQAIENEVKKSGKKMNKGEYGKIADMQSKLFDASNKMTQTMKTLEPLLAEGIKIKEKFNALGLVD